MFLFCYTAYVCSGASRFIYCVCTLYPLGAPGVRFYTPESPGANVVNGGGFPICVSFSCVPKSRSFNGIRPRSTL